MKFKAGMLIGLGAGYVLGAKAGRDRYQQILDATRAFMDNPGVQRLTDEVGKTVNIGKDRMSDATSRRVERVSSSLADQASKAKGKVAGKSSAGPSTGPSTGPSPGTASTGGDGDDETSAASHRNARRAP